MSRILNAIVAVCPDLGIGRNGELPWHPIRLKYGAEKLTLFSSSTVCMVFIRVLNTGLVSVMNLNTFER